MMKKAVAKLRRLNERLPIAGKYMAVSFATGLILWALLDHYHNKRLEMVFRQDLMERLAHDSMHDRYMFDAYVKRFSRSAKIIVNQSAFLDYVSKKRNYNKNLPVMQDMLPVWMPSRETIEAGADIRYIILLDEHGNADEIYQSRHSSVPDVLLKPDIFVLQKSMGKSYLTEIDGTPFLITSERFSFRESNGILMLATPIDDDFLVSASGPGHYKNIVAMADGIENRILASSRPDLIHKGTAPNALAEKYVISNKSFFDYGSSDLLVQFVSLKPLEELTGPLNNIRSKNSQQIAITGLVFSLFSTLIIFLIGERIRRFTKGLSALSQILLGTKYKDIEKGDELAILKNNFDRLCREILEANKELKLRNQELRQEIAERKKAEEEQGKLEAQLLQTQKMETIGTLAGGIAHDFNNILTPIMNNTSLAMMKLDDADSCRRYLEQNLKAASRAKELVQQILIFSRKGEYEVKTFQIYSIVEESLKLVRASIPATIEIHQNLHPDCGVILGDPTQIQQVLINLCTNAYHAMRDTGGLIYVTLDETNIDAEFASQHPNLRVRKYARLTVSDTGHGMSEATIRRIFDPFFTTKGAGKGSGLGLSVVHGIVMRHDGEILVRSKPNDGTTFTVYLPLSKVPFRHELPVENYEHCPGGDNSILLVDDENMIALSTGHLLERFGYKVTSVKDGLSALKEIRVHPGKYDVVITDKNMPGMTGIHLAQELIKLRQNLPLILISGYSEDITQEKLREHGIQEFLAKPFSVKDLIKAIERALDKGIQSK